MLIGNLDSTTNRWMEFYLCLVKQYLTDTVPLQKPGLFQVM